MTVATTPGPDAAVVPFDFRRPPWISRERRAVMDGIHVRLLPSLAQLLTGELGRPATLQIRDLAQVTFGDWRLGLPAPCVAFLVPLGPGTAGEGLVTVEPTLALQLIDLLFGGRGDIGNRPRALTALEQGVLGQMLDRFLAAFRDGYREIVALTPGPARFEEIVERIAIVERHDRIFLLEFEIQAGEVRGPLTLCLPATQLAGFVADGPAAAGSRAVPAEPARALLEAHVRAARVPVVVRLPGLQLSARDSATLAPGQVLETSQLFHGTVELHVSGRRLFQGALGRHQGHVGLRVLGPVEATSFTPPRVMRRTESP